MKRIGTGFFWILLGSMFVSVAAHAGQFTKSDIGASVPYWIESPAVNDRGEVAWTELDPSTFFGTAQYYFNGDVVPLAPTPAKTSSASWATDIAQNGSIVGYASSNARLVDSRALLWLSEGEGAFKQLELSGAFEIPMQQTMARGVIGAATDDGTDADSGHVVVGFARERVASNILPMPAVWRVNSELEVEAYRLAMPTAFKGGNGMIVSVGEVDADGLQFACGNAAPKLGYTHATCWEISSGDLEGRVGTLIKDLQTLAPTTSLVSRVRTLPIGPQQELQTLVIGSYLDADARWSGWVYNLTTKELWADKMGFVKGADSFAFDAAKVRYADEEEPLAHGWMVGGYSATHAGLPTLDGSTGPNDVVHFPLRGAVVRRLLHGVNKEGMTCDINDEAQKSEGSYYQVVALSTDDTYRLVREGAELKMLTNVAVDSPVEVRVRDTQIRENALQSSAGIRGSTATPYTYYQAQAAFPNGEALLVLSDGPGCAPVTMATGHLAACNSDSLATTDLEGRGGKTLLLEPVTGRSGFLRSAKENDVFDFSTLPFAQLAYRDETGDCTMSPVMSTAKTVVTVNPEQDFDSDVRWYNCHDEIDGFDTDVRFAYDHCGRCGISVDDNLSCTNDSCDDGKPLSELQANKCLIDDACYAGEELRIESDFTNPCQSCQPDESTSAWSLSAPNTCCDPSGQPILDEWDRTGDGKGTDKNSGATPDAVTMVGPTYNNRSWWSRRVGQNKTSCQESVTRVNNATFTPGVDEADWYQLQFEGPAGEAWLEPRADLMVNNSAEKDLEVCVFVECTAPNSTTSISYDGSPGGEFGRSCTDKDGSSGCATRRPMDSPAQDAVGACGRTSAGTWKASVEIAYSCGPNINKNADVYIRVIPLEIDDRQQCTSYNYDLRMGNDIGERCDATGISCNYGGYKNGTNSCVGCCDE